MSTLISFVGGMLSMLVVEYVYVLVQQKIKKRKEKDK